MKHIIIKIRIVQKLSLSAIVIVLLLITTSCQDQFEQNEKYQRPDWLVGKLFTQIEAQENFALFAQCMRDVGYDSIVNKSGSYAAFVPTDDAIQEFLKENMYSSISDIPLEEKERLVKFHLVQMPWNINQLQGLSSRGWTNENDISNNQPLAFKRQTLLRNENKSYPVRVQRQGNDIVETIVPSGATTQKTVHSNSRKYVPFFYDSYLDAVNMSANDYSFYFERPYEYGNIYFAGAKVIGEEIFSDNGFIYAVDRVVEPLGNAEELMERGFENETYLAFKDLINQGSTFTFNAEATYSQSGASAGIDVEELFNLHYPGILFDMHQELIGNEGATMEGQFGIVVPTDEAFNEFVEEVIKSSGKITRIEDIPVNLKRMIINTHMSSHPIYESEVNNGFYNAVGDLVEIDPSSIIQKEFGSNATFIGVNKMLIPKALSSVSGFLYLDPDYLTYLMALQFADLLEALKDEDSYFSFFVIPNRVFIADHSMEIRWNNPFRQDAFSIRAHIPGIGQHTYTRNEVADLMFSQIGIEPLIGTANKEFIETLNGKHIIVDNVHKTITGGVPSAFGYEGDSIIDVHFTPLEGNYYNGDVYEINSWLRFPGQALLTRLYGTKYFDLLNKAGLATEFQLRFTHPAERYTIFLPSENALNAVQADTLTGDNLKHFLLSHIIKNELIFTDGRKNEGAYNTISRKQDGTGFHKLLIRPSFDNISILDTKGEVIIDIPEEQGKTNIITTRTLNGMISTSAVIHRIDSVIIL